MWLVLCSTEQKVLLQVRGVPGGQYNDTRILSPTNKLDVDTRIEENRRFIAG